MLYLYAPQNTAQLSSLLRDALPGTEIAVWPDAVAPADIRYIVAWNPPEGFFVNFENLQAVFVLGAGIDRFLSRTDIPAHIPLVRLTDAGMAEQMAEYVLYGVMRYQRNFDTYQYQQSRREWKPLAPKLPKEVRVSVLGLGAIGSVVATKLAGSGYAVSGWSRSPKSLPDVACCHGTAALDTLLAKTDVLISVLPSTPETRGLMNRERLSRLPRGAALINAGRGDQFDEEALLEMLEDGHLRHAQLDVFANEPLPPQSPLWGRPDVMITPHVAAITLLAPAVEQIANNLRALEAGIKPLGLVDRTKAY